MEATNHSYTLNIYSFKTENPSLPDSISESSLATLEIRMIGSFGGGPEGAPYESLIPYVERFVGEAAEALGFKEFGVVAEVYVITIGVIDQQHVA
ncbi:hypothetical protein PanWU01x14_339040 [Parasponia andersonii]|uniref:Uncharacterized protein n=1 Tax=Parasponia andersonii TaxID=3476 RepID=A0A2P5AEW9_PARAD|nr:hypothetical protein PanWU01x14_339040 [Parasponia andersonii]